MRQLFCHLQSHPKRTLFLTFLYVVATILPHDQVNNLFLRLSEVLTLAVYDQVMMLIAATGLLGASLWLLSCLRTGPAPAIKTFYWLASLVLTALAFPLLVAVNSEAVHFLQYAILALPLLALTGSFSEAIGWATIIGIADEAFQYGVLHAHWGIYFDFNDVVLNLLGAGLGLVGLSICCRAEKVWNPIDRRWAISHLALAGLLFAVLALQALGVLALHPPENGERPWLLLSRSPPESQFWTSAGEWGGTFHILSAHEGLVVLFLLLLFYSRLDAFLSLKCDRQTGLR